MHLILLLVALLAVFALGYTVGRTRQNTRDAATGPTPVLPLPASPSPASSAPPSPSPIAATLPPAATIGSDEGAVAERARIIRSLESETAAWRGRIARRDAFAAQLPSLATERERLFAALADARAETARYRQLVVDLENDAPPPLLGGRGAPDDLKLIVGLGPVLERMLYQLGVTSYRQIARWSERDIDDMDACLHEFPGRIRRDGWVTQARALYLGKYGEPLPARDRP